MAVGQYLLLSLLLQRQALLLSFFQYIFYRLKLWEEGPRKKKKKLLEN